MSRIYRTHVTFVASYVKFVTRFSDKTYFIDTFIVFDKIYFNRKIGNLSKSNGFTFLYLIAVSEKF